MPTPARPTTKTTDRPLAVAALIFANLALFLVLQPFAEYSQRFYRMGWPTACCGGLAAGQATWFVLWFVYARSHLAYRAAVTAILGAVMGVGIVVGGWLAKIPSTHWHLFFQADLRQLEQIKDCTVTFWMFVWLIYVLLLPSKRLRGISLGNPAADAQPRLRPHQISILDLMLWTCVVIVPLGIVRVFLVQYLARTFFDVLLMSGYALAFGLPVFRAAFAKKYTLLWLLAVIAYVGALTVGIDQFFFLKSQYFTRTAVAPLRDSLVVAGLACLTVYANCWALKCLGMEWLKSPKPTEELASATDSIAHSATIAPQPTSL